jgi:hypothetical protein
MKKEGKEKKREREEELKKHLRFGGNVRVIPMAKLATVF